MADLLNIGAQCSLSTCTLVDFLPILCRCQNYFCREHILPAVHACPSNQREVMNDTEWENMEKCGVEGCRKHTLNVNNVNSHIEAGEGQKIKATCGLCQKSFCADHRHPKSHSCTPPVLAGPPKNEAARALLAKNFPSSSSASSNPLIPTTSTASAPSKVIPRPGDPRKPRAPKIPTDPVKLAVYHKVELLKMRHRAVPLDSKDSVASVGVGERHHFKVAYSDPEKDGEKAEKVFWVRKTAITGKVLDLLLLKLGLSSSAASPLHLQKPSASDPEVLERLQYDQPFGNQVPEGSAVALSRVV